MYKIDKHRDSQNNKAVQIDPEPRFSNIVLLIFHYVSITDRNEYILRFAAGQYCAETKDRGISYEESHLYLSHRPQLP